MIGKWPLAKINDISERVAMGPFGSSIKVETFVSNGIPIISGQHLNGFKIDDKAGYNFITIEHADKLKHANVYRGDVIFTHAGNIGQVSFIPNNSLYQRYVISQRQFFLRPKQDKVLPEYLVAYFKSPEGQQKLLANTSSVGVPSISQPVSYLRNLEIPLPPLEEQRAIAHILCTLDDKIELNRRMNETLEQMARAIFKSWFVDFDPVRAKMSGRWKKGDSLPGLPAHLWDLFPDRLIPSELGEIPQGWKLGKFGDCCIVKGGFAYKSKDFVKKGYPLVRIKNITTARTIDLSDAACIPERIVNQTENFKLFDGDLVIAMTGANIGKFGLVVNPDQIPFSLINQRVAKVIPKDVTSPKPWFPFLAMIESNIFGQIINLGGGSAQPNISSGQI